MATLDVAGSAQHIFVTLTLFGEDGWATDDEMWASHHEEALSVLLTRLTQMPPPEADAVVEDLLTTWRQQGGPAEGTSLTRRFGFGVVGVLLAVAVVAALLTWAVVAALS